MATVLKRILYMTLVLLTAACSTSEDDSSLVEGGSVTVAFDAKMGSGITTRASDNINIIDNIDALKPADKGFGVFACYTGLHKYEDSNVHPDFMYNEHVTWNSINNVWEYTPLKYWPNGEGEVAGLTGINPHYVSFMAYAPWCDDTHPNYCIPSFSLQGEVGNPWLTYRLGTTVANQVDLLCARPLLDQTKPSNGEKLPFVFDHALACVGNEVNTICSSALMSQIRGRVNGSTIKKAKVEVTALSIEYTLTSKARLIFWNKGEMNWQTIFSEDPVCTRTVTFDIAIDEKTIHEYDKPTVDEPTETYNPIKKTDQGVFYIPAEFKGYHQTAVVSLTYNIATFNGTDWTNESTITGSATITLSRYPEAFQPGKHLYINVTLNPMNIELTAAIAPWVVIQNEIDGIEE